MFWYVIVLTLGVIVATGVILFFARKEGKKVGKRFAALNWDDIAGLFVADACGTIFFLAVVLACDLAGKV